jgi:glycosyltransferase involved in cell wall biosynthesis
VPNAIDVERFSIGTGERDDYLLFLGRMCTEKGAHRAIEVARAAGRRLVIAAKCREEPELEYFQRYVEPHLGDGIEYVGEASLEEKVELLQRAAVTLVPIEWEEPFGLVMIESAACGTPVVATRRGSVPEVVIEGVTGIVVDDHLDMPAVLDRASALDPVAMREAIVSRFDAERMVSGYVLAYEDALRRTGSRNGSGPRRTRTQVARLREALSYTPPASTKTLTRRRT